MAPPWQWQVAVVVLAIALIASVITDLRKRLILNAVTLPALAIVLALFFWLVRLQKRYGFIARRIAWEAQPTAASMTE